MEIKEAKKRKKSKSKKKLRRRGGPVQQQSPLRGEKEDKRGMSLIGCT